MWITPKWLYWHPESMNIYSIAIVREASRRKRQLKYKPWPWGDSSLVREWRNVHKLQWSKFKTQNEGKVGRKNKLGLRRWSEKNNLNELSTIFPVPLTLPGSAHAFGANASSVQIWSFSKTWNDFRDFSRIIKVAPCEQMLEHYLHCVRQCEWYSTRQINLKRLKGKLLGVCLNEMYI